NAFVKALSRSLRHRAKRGLGLSSVDEERIATPRRLQRANPCSRNGNSTKSVSSGSLEVENRVGGLCLDPLTSGAAEEVPEIANHCCAEPVTGHHHVRE